MAKFTHSVTGKVAVTKRAGTSNMGNPTWLVGIETPAGDDLVFRTSSNISLSYAINNPEYRDNLHTFELTKAGRLSGRFVKVEA